MMYLANENFNPWTADRGKANTLFAVPIKGSGSSMVESFTSYISRLAGAHSVSVGTFINNILTPQLNKPYLNRISANGGSRFYDRSSSLNGMSSTADELVSVVDSLTVVNGLFTTTMLPYKSVISNRGLIRKTKAWCPECLKEGSSTDNIYEPLLWTLNVIHHCDVHLVKLQVRCPSCDKSIPHLSRNIQQGVCPYCSVFLGGMNVQRELLTEIEILNIYHVRSLLESAQSPNFRTHDVDPTPYLQQYIQRDCSGNASEAARRMGVPKHTLWYWYKGTTLPSLEQVLKILRLQKPSEPSISIKKPDKTTKPSPKRPECRSNHHINIETRLKDILSGGYTPSLTVVAQSIGTTTKYLYKHFPTLAREVSRAHQSYVHANAKVRLLNLSKQIRDTTHQLYSQGIYPSRRKVEAALKKPALLHEASLRDTWHEALQECLHIDRH